MPIDYYIPELHKPISTTSIKLARRTRLAPCMQQPLATFSESVSNVRDTEGICSRDVPIDLERKHSNLLYRIVFRDTHCPKHGFL